ncbi:MAG: TetM/TetW/TetO/TetS family tetracycline resistance ribosomal protection protein [Clostridia bacterium]|nr:TetM/TetW/TetO/TetS family tetracycline resistance ribosomal protection protein [Clostridia bacterium]
MKKKIVIGILAHVDAGKTTLSEALLYLSGKIRTLGRVDHGNTYLDTNDVERERGITVFSKQARFSTDACDYVLLDTPGHIDFSAETERTLALLDYAVLVVSGADGVQNHTRTLWHLLERYNVPTFIFVNKCDIAIKLKEELETELCSSLSDKCVAFFDGASKASLDEKLAAVNEDFFETFFDGDEIDDADIADAVARRELFPCVYGSALKLQGIEKLLSVLDTYCLPPVYSDDTFGGRVYKIGRDKNLRLTYLKVTSGKLCVRDELSYISADGVKHTEKIDRIRLYSGERFEQTESVCAGEICAVSGLEATYAGQGLGCEADGVRPYLEPVLSYRIVLPAGCDVNMYYPRLKELEEEEPSLQLCWNDESAQIEARLMGEIQIDIIKRMISDRLGINCDFDSGSILYKEKAAANAVGVGHYEPLRHYAEVQLLIEPMPKGSGLVFDTDVAENTLAKNWQRLILTHLYEKAHRGTLTGALLTDTKITLIAGRAHLKHTEGGDFREATYRAVRQGLMKCGCELLEPYYKFRLELPAESIGRAMSELNARSAEFEIISNTEEAAVIEGRGPVYSLRDLPRAVVGFTGGKGSVSCVSDGYEPCHNKDEIVSASQYDPEADLKNSPHSVFCAHGAGFLVPWYEVDSYKHIELDEEKGRETAVIPKSSDLARKYSLSDKDIEEIMLRTFGPIKRPRYSEARTVTVSDKKKHVPKATKKPHKRMVIVDGYNLIYSWDRLKYKAEKSLDDAREELMNILANYVGFTKTELVLVFDAYLVKDGTGSDFYRDSYRVVFTKSETTADAFIEKMMHDIGPDYNISVVTGDRLVQCSAVNSGILRVTPKEFADELTAVGNEINDFVRKFADSKNNP